VRRTILKGNFTDVLKMAMQMESDAIAYYAGLPPTVSSDAVVLRAIIEEEKRHLAALHLYSGQITNK
jgi:rubrerythrin